MNRGTFVISLDTELAWGMFDVVDIAEYASVYRATPTVVDRLCTLFDEYDVPATWAVVAHLLQDCQGEHTGGAFTAAGLPEWYESLPCRDGTDRDLWFAPGLVDRIWECEVDQELGMHGYTHRVLDEGGCTREMAVEEVNRGRRVLEANGIEPESFVFPRNEIGHLDVLSEFGFTTFRGVDARWHETAPIPSAARKGLRFLDEAAGRPPPVVTPRRRDGLVEIPGSQIFRPAHGWWGLVPTETAVERARKGLERAAERGGVFHLWFHPFNLARHPDELLEGLEQILSRAASLRLEDRLEIRSMGDVAARHRG